MKISIITASYNSADTIRDTLESVLSQDYADFEHIIIDGGSTDGTLDIIKEYEDRYQGRLKWQSEPDKGIYDAMNKGLKLSTGEVIGVLSTDDFFAASNILSTVDKNATNVDAIYGDLVYLSHRNKNKIVREWVGSQYTDGAFLKGWHPAHPTFYVKKKVYDKLGGYDLSFDISADFELMLRFFEKGKISNKYVPVTFVKMRIGGESTGSLGNIIKGNKNVMRAFVKNGYKVPRFYLMKRLMPKAANMVKTKISNLFS